MPQPPKLRSSCDECGLAKLKCDRGRPECGRCLSLDLPCVYGLSRKNGKPPRRRLDTGGSVLAGTTMSRLAKHGSNSAGDDEMDASHGNRDSNPVSVDAFTNRLMNGADTWDAFNPSLSLQPAVTSLDFGNTLDKLQTDFSAPFTQQPGMASLDFGNVFEQPFDTAPTPNPESPVPEVLTDSARMTDGPRLDEFDAMPGLSEATLFPPFADSWEPKNSPDSGPDKDTHDCFGEAHEILGHLAFNDAGRPTCGFTPPSDDSSVHETASLQCRIRHNREAVERLGRLLTCSCVSSTPSLALLYASIIARVLAFYQEAASQSYMHIQNISGIHAVRSDGRHALSTTPALHSQHHASPTSKNSNGSGFGVSSGSRNRNRKSITGLTSSMTASSLPLDSPCYFAPSYSAPAKVAYCSFDVDDARMQTAMKMQLLLGEIRRAGRLVGQLRGRQEHDVHESTLDDCGSLYHSLDAWLRVEHARLTSFIRSQLRELNT